MTTNRTRKPTAEEILRVRTTYRQLQRYGYCNLSIEDQDRFREMSAWLRTHGVPRSALVPR